tara:strand:- start:270 stop:494 length:225 start_codon:yes stop_codon:yes gene_type:complete
VTGKQDRGARSRVNAGLLKYLASSFAKKRGSSALARGKRSQGKLARMMASTLIPLALCRELHCVDAQQSSHGRV